MDKSELDILLECQKELASLKERIGVLETRISILQEKQAEAPAEVPAEADEVDFTGVEIGVAAPADAIVPEVEMADVPNEEPIDIEPMAELEPEPVVPDAPSVIPSTPTVIPSEASVSPATPDETANLPWRKDNPGMLVKNIRSGISLLDRAQFIGTLFKEDFALYDNTIAALNTMNSLDEAVAYIKTNFPQWNLGSDVVYRFMMAIRKKLG
ncbi:MAG: hypothetical protein IK074_08310 [Bacteroidales bacterium]|nr:hypothetical protein [Bacteroidales bacterium]